MNIYGIGFFILNFSFLSSAITKEFIAEMQEDIAKAKANPLPIQGIAVSTIAGAQLTPASATPSEVLINQQIFNDIGRLRTKMQDFMVDITAMGTRYNKAPEFELSKKRLEDVMTQIENDLRTKLKH